MRAMKKLVHVLVWVGALLSIGSASAAISPVSLAIYPPVQLPGQEFTITGARVGLSGRHHNMYGLDVGAIGNVTKQNFLGVGIGGIFNMTQGTTTILGAQIAGIANINTDKSRIFGVQIACVNSNRGESSMLGIGAGLANLSPHMVVTGAQIGLYNEAKDVYGFQIGLINTADMLHGVQIGLLNFNKRGLFSVSPFLNIGF